MSADFTWLVSSVECRHRDADVDEALASRRRVAAEE
jgi:hypothetical protein